MERPDPGLEASAEHERPSLRKRLLRDFYLSFKFSQGERPLQFEFMHLVSGYYHNNLELPDIWDLETALDETRQHAENMSAKDHGGKSFEKNEFKKTWDEFDKIIRNSKASNSVDSNLRQSVNGMLERDIKYQGKTRPSKKEGEDVHESQLREYVVLARPTGSEAYDAIFTDARDRLDELTAGNNKYQELITAWEQNHPGELFTPAQQQEAA